MRIPTSAIPLTLLLLTLSSLASCDVVFVARPSTSEALRTTSYNLPNGAFTIEFWYKTTEATTGLHVFVNMCTYTYTNNVVVTMRIPDVCDAGFRNVGMSPFPTGCPSSGMWTHVALVFDPVAEEGRYYANSGIIGTFALPGVTTSDPLHSFTLGNDRDSGCTVNDPNQAARGIVSEFRIWARALTLPEIIAAASGPVLASAPDLHVYFTFDPAHVSGSTVSQVPGMSTSPLYSGGLLPKFTSVTIRPVDPFTPAPSSCVVDALTPVLPLAIPVAAPAVIHGLAAADLDGDSLVDLVYLQYATSAGGETLGFALSNGNLTFQPPVVVATTAYLISVRVGDLTGNGRPDLLVLAGTDATVYLASDPPAALSYTVAPYDGGTGHVTTFAVTAYASAIVGDITGDGNADVVTATSSSVYVVSCTPTVATSTTVFTRSSIALPTRQPNLVDYDGDGDGDLMYIDSSTSPSIAVVALHDGSGTLFNDGARTTLAVDYNNIIILAPTYFALSSGRIDAFAIFHCPGDSTHALVAQLDSNFIPWEDVVMGDVDGDGRDDIIMYGRAQAVAIPLVVSFQLATHSFSTPVEMLASGPSGMESVVVVDWDGDGTAELTTGATDGATAGKVQVWISKPAPLYAATPVTTIAAPCASALLFFRADINHDGRIDHPAVCLADGSLTLFLTHSPSSVFQPSPNPLPAPLGALADAAVVDLDSNGILDWVALLASGDVAFVSEPAFGSTPTPTVFAGSSGAITLLCTDVNGDGDVDVVLGGPSGLTLLTNAGLGAPLSSPLLGPPTPLFTGASIASVAHLAASASHMAWSDATPGQLSLVALSPSFSPAATPTTVALGASPVALVFATLDASAPSPSPAPASAVVLLTNGALVAVAPGPSPTTSVLVTLATPPPSVGVELTPMSDQSTLTSLIGITMPGVVPPVVYATSARGRAWQTVLADYRAPAPTAPAVVFLSDVDSDSVLDLVEWTNPSLSWTKGSAFTELSTPTLPHAADVVPECGGVRGSLVCISAHLVRRTTSVCAARSAFVLPPVPPSGSRCVRAHSPAASGYHELAHSVTVATGTVDCAAAGGVTWSVGSAAAAPVVTLEDVVLTTSNAAVAYTSGSAGGALVVGGGTLELTRTTVANFAAVGIPFGDPATAYGGAVRVTASGTLVATNATFSSCSAAQLGGAVAVFAGGSAVVRGTTFAGNAVTGAPVSVKRGGGAIGASGPNSVVVDACVFDSNVAGGLATYSGGGAVALSELASAATITRSVFVGNSAPGGYGGAVLAELAFGSSLTISNSSFDTSSAWIGGTFAVADLGVIPATLPPGTTLAGVPPSALVELTAASRKVVLSESTVGQSDAHYGGMVYSCGVQMDASSAHLSGAVLSASRAGGVYFVCPPLSATPAFVAATNVSGTLVEATAYGPIGATAPTRIQAVTVPSVPIPAGYTLGRAAGFVLADAFGSAVVDPAVQVEIASIPLFIRDNAAFGAEFDAATGTYVPLRVSFEIEPGYWPAQLGVPFDVVATPDTDLTEPDASVLFSVTLSACPFGAGAVSDSLDASLACTPCASGTESLTESVAACTVIPVCIEPALPINGSCQECPANTVRAVVGSGVPPCVCSQGFWNVNNARNQACAPCPSGATCDGGEGAGAAPYAQPGFGPTGAHEFSECKIENACLGRGVCAAEYAPGSLLCKDCAKDAYRKSDGTCEVCPNAASSLLGLLVLCVVGAAVLAVVVGLFAALQYQERERETASVGRTSHSRIPHTVSLGVIFLQVLGILAQAPFDWPEPPVQQVLDAANVANVDLTIFAVDCSIPSFMARYALNVLLPLVFGLFVVAILGMVKSCSCLSCCCLKRVDRASLSVGDVTVWGVFTFGPLVFIPLARTSLVYFDCTRYPDGSWYLDAEPSIRCFSTEWLSTLPLAVLGLGVYVVALPALFAGVLYRKRGELDEPRVLLRYGPMYTVFRRYYFWAGLVGLMKRLAIVSVAVFASDVQVVLFSGLLCVFMASLVATSQMEPFLFHPLNNVELKLDCCIVVVIVCGMLFWTNDFPSTFMFVVCVVCALGAIAFGVATLVGGFATEVRARMAARKVGRGGEDDVMLGHPRVRVLRHMIERHLGDVPPDALTVLVADLAKDGVDGHDGDVLVGEEADTVMCSSLQSSSSESEYGSTSSTESQARVRTNMSRPLVRGLTRRREHS